MRDIGRLNKTRDAFSFPPLPRLTVKASIQYRNGAVRINTVSGTDLTQTMLETVIQAGNFIPGTEVAALIESSDWLDAIRHTGARRQIKTQKAKQPISDTLSISHCDVSLGFCLKWDGC